MRIMGLDLGEKNIGVAVSDPLGLTAQGITVIHRVNLKSDLYQIKNLIKRYNVTEIIIGLPLNMNGTAGPSAQMAQRFSSYLKKEVDIPVHLWDERLTTTAAEKVLLEGDVSRFKRKRVIDKMAAVLILESYLASRKNN